MVVTTLRRLFQKAVLQRRVPSFVLAAVASFMAVHVVTSQGGQLLKAKRDAKQLTSSTAVTTLRAKGSNGATSDSAEIVVAFIGSYKCTFADWKLQHEAVKTVRAVVRLEAKERKLRVVVAGIAIDESADAGLAYLRSFDGFDELIAGRMWMTKATGALLDNLVASSPATPQFVVLERVKLHSTDGNVHERGRVLLRYRAVGTQQISRWIAGGARIPSAVITSLSLDKPNAPAQAK